MNITPKRAKVIAQRYAELCQKADRFLDSLSREEKRNAQEYGYGMPSVAVDESGNVLVERNTACHCHPEFRTFKHSAEKFFRWLEEDSKSY